MIKTSTLTITSTLTTSQSEKKQEEIQLPDPDSYRDEPSATCINSILNFSRSYQVLKSTMVNEIEIVKS